MPNIFEMLGGNTIVEPKAQLDPTTGRYTLTPAKLKHPILGTLSGARGEVQALNTKAQIQLAQDLNKKLEEDENLVREKSKVTHGTDENIKLSKELTFLEIQRQVYMDELADIKSYGLPPGAEEEYRKRQAQKIAENQARHDIIMKQAEISKKNQSIESEKVDVEAVRTKDITGQQKLPRLVDENTKDTLAAESSARKAGALVKPKEEAAIRALDASTRASDAEANARNRERLRRGEVVVPFGTNNVPTKNYIGLPEASSILTPSPSIEPQQERGIPPEVLLKMRQIFSTNSPANSLGLSSNNSYMPFMSTNAAVAAKAPTVSRAPTLADMQRFLQATYQYQRPPG